jgi:hypothetical protein
MQNPFMLGEGREKWDYFYTSSWTRRKRNITVTIEEFVTIVKKRSTKH